MFKRYIGIDWSGAKGPYLSGLKVASCSPGKGAPELINPPSGSNWRRDKLVEWIFNLVENQGPILIGFDFAFAFAFCDHNAYFPGNLSSPDNPFKLWQAIDEICYNVPNFYAGPFFKTRESPFAEYLCYQEFTGDKYEHRLRVTERFANTDPVCTFKFVGPGQVGTGSAAGMRVLNYFREVHGNTFDIWPFDKVRGKHSAVVEIFPRLYFIEAGVDQVNWTDSNAITEALKYFDSEPLDDSCRVSSKDEADSIISSAALRYYAFDEECWITSKMDYCAKNYEGWIFGVK